jgi:hypothetical protein
MLTAQNEKTDCTFGPKVRLKRFLSLYFYFILLIFTDDEIYNVFFALHTKLDNLLFYSPNMLENFSAFSDVAKKK